MSGETPRRVNRVVVVHGIGPFDEAQALADVTLASSFGGSRDVEVTAVNWRVLFASAYVETNLDRDWMISLSAAVHRAKRVGSTSCDSDALGLPHKPIGLVDALMQILEVPLSFWVLVGIAPVFLPVSFSTIGKATAAVLAVYVTTALFALVISSHKGVTLASLTRRVGLTLLWPFAHFILTPEILGTSRRILPIGMLVVGVWLFFAFDANVPLVGFAVAFLAFIVAIVLVRVRAAHSVALTLLMDIVRYVGDPIGRRRIEEKFDTTVLPMLADTDDLTIVGHSLGSMIAIDFLLRRSDHLHRLSAVRLITLGSPLRRWFCRWFPSVWPRPSAICASITAALPKFSWINVYRPLDPVGTRLDLKSGRALEMTTGQRRYLLGWLGAHVDYWNDPSVAAAVDRALTTKVCDIGTVEAGVLIPASRLHLGRNAAESRTFDQSPGLVADTRFLTVAMLLLIIAAVAHPIARWNLSDSAHAREIYELTYLSDGIVEMPAYVRCGFSNPTRANSRVACSGHFNGTSYPVRWTHPDRLRGVSGATVRFRSSRPDLFVLPAHPFAGISVSAAWGFSLVLAAVGVLFCGWFVGLENLGAYMAILLGDTTWTVV